MPSMFHILLLGLFAQLTVGQFAGSGLEVLNGEDLLSYRDCHSLFKAGYKTDGTYKIRDGSLVSCTFDANHGYTVILRRQDGFVDFARDMQDYVQGFGSPNGEQWLGLDKIHSLCDNNTLLSVKFTDWKDQAVSMQYNVFYINGQADDYKLNIGGYQGLSVIYDALSYNDGMPFATHDARDRRGCVDQMKGGWWYKWCSYALPTGKYYEGGWYKKTTPIYYDGIYWFKYKGMNYSLKTFTMAISQH